MRWIVVSSLVFGAGLATFAQPPSPQAALEPQKLARAQAILRDLPGNFELSEWAHKISDKNLEKLAPEVVAELRQKRLAAAASYDELYTCIEPGRSVFDYPGLIALGKIRFLSSPDMYRLLLGVHTPHDRNALYSAHEFHVLFNPYGIIKSVSHDVRILSYD
jgi:hypothetical protein